ncbi:MAG: ABC transporter substrate-binding protein [Methanothrix sp.]|nr:ABC transporter substrate-binding protein [Methanothrix sp.]
MVRNKFIWLAVILCASAFILPALAGSFTLKIYGNANMDNIIDEKDAEYIRGVVSGTQHPTMFSDTNLDGTINENDAVLAEKIVNGTEENLTIIDSANSTITVKYPIKTLVSLNQHSAECIKILSEEEKIIGVEQYVADKTEFFPDLSKLPVVKSGSDCDFEKILSLHPEVAIAYGWNGAVSSSLEYAKSLEPHVTVIGLNLYQPYNISQEMAQLGYLMGNPQRAYEFIDFYESYLDMIKEKVSQIPEEKRTRVYLEQNKDFAAASNGSGLNDMCTLAGGDNIALGLVGSSPTVDQEWVIQQNPEVIVKTANHGNKYMGYEKENSTDARALRETILNRTGWQNIKAVQDDRVFMLSDSNAAKPTFFIGVAYLAKFFYPDLFADLDPQAIHQEYLTRFQRLDYDLSKRGVFVYPPLEE